MEGIFGFLTDIRRGARSLAHRPGFALAAIVTLTLGIGANAAIFSVIDAVLLAPLPYDRPEERVMIWSRWRSFDKTWVSEAEVLDYRNRSRTLADVAAWAGTRANLTGEGEPERVGASMVTPNTFSVLGSRPMLGRTFTSEEGTGGGPEAVVLGHALWKRRYGGDPALVGKTVRVDGRSPTVVGVMPPGFALPTDYTEAASEPTQLWLPLVLDEAEPVRGSHGYFAAARLLPGATAEAASRDLARITAQLTAEGEYHREMEFTAFAVPLEEEILGQVRPAVLLLAGAVAFLLLIACANVANLLLARAERRRREIAVRSALGAGRWRIVRHLLGESVALALVAGAAGLGLAATAVRAVAALHPPGIPRLDGVHLDGRTLLFCAGLALATTLLFSLAPVLKAFAVDLVSSLKEGGGGAASGRRQRRLRGVLVVVQVGLAVALTIGAGLMVRSLWALSALDLGFRPEGVLTARLALPTVGYEEPEEVVRFYRDLVERVRTLPGVRHAGILRALPLQTTIGDWGLDVEGFVESPGHGAKGDWQVASDGALEALGVRLLQGRRLEPGDTADGRQVAVINRTMARAYWPDGEALGGRFRMGAGDDGDAPWITVVGIVEEVRHNGMTGGVKEKFYRPHAQFHRSTGFALRGMTLVAEAEGDPAALAGPIRTELRALDPDVPLATVQTLEEVVATAMATTRLTGLLLGSFALLALLLAAVGVYGVLAYLVAQRTREIGIRRALGAPSGRLLRRVLSEGLLLALLGVGLGIILARAGARWMASLLYEVQPADPSTFAVAAGILILVAVLASLLPAWRATRVDPLVALES